MSYTSTPDFHRAMWYQRKPYLYVEPNGLIYAIYDSEEFGSHEVLVEHGPSPR